MTDALDTLIAGVVDYAGLFPPAKLDMDVAVRNYAAYLTDPDNAMLGRFVVPVSRLPEFDQAASALLPRGAGSAPWLLTALIGADPSADFNEALKFNCRHWAGSEIGHAIIDSVELQATTVAEIGAAMSILPSAFRAFVEIPLDPDPAPLIAELRRTRASAKIRTGGVTPTAFPDPAHVARFLERCRENGVAFKATAGLHHPIRAEYRLTYEPNPPFGTMYGYLNILVASAFAWVGGGQTLIRHALEESWATDFAFSDTELSYRGYTIPVAKLRDVRKSFMTSFGSCSFREPVDDLRELGLH